MSDRRIVFVALGFIIILLTFKPSASAQSDYVLPYPSFMPGSKWYIVREVVDKFKKYWYFGTFAQFKYNLYTSDKYLVEAKTLFEYKQYLLGYQSLRKSNQYFTTLKSTLKKAKREGKSIKEKEALLSNAAEKHIEVLGVLSQSLPATFEWKPEKEQPLILHLQKLISASIEVRHLSM